MEVSGRSSLSRLDTKVRPHLYLHLLHPPKLTTLRLLFYLLPASRDSAIELAQVKTAGEGDSSDSDDSDDEIIATDASGTPIPGPMKIKTAKRPKGPPPPVAHPQIFQSSMTRPSPWDRAPAPPRDDGTPWPVVEVSSGPRSWKGRERRRTKATRLEF